MNNLKKQVILKAYKYSLVAAPLMYIGFFLDAGINSYSANITGEFFNAVMGNQYNIAQNLLGNMLITLLISVVILPIIALGTNVLFFYLSLKHDYYITSVFFKKTYENMMQYSCGEIVQKLFRDPGDFLTLLVSIPAKMLAQISAFIFMIFLMIRISPLLCVICISLGVLAAVCPLFFKRKLAKLDDEYKSFSDRTASIESEMVQSREFYKSYGIEEFAIRNQASEFDSYYHNYLQRGVRIEMLAAVIPEGLLLIGKLSFLIVGLQQVVAGKLGAGDLVAFFTYITLTASLVTMLHNQGRQMTQLADSIKRVEGLIEDAESDSARSNADKWNHVYASDLSYKYAENGPWIRYNDFKISKNSLVEIKGGNGAGKTTLILLLSGLLNAKRGKVMIDDKNMDAIDLLSWRKNITFVEQIPAIFQGTLRENIHLGNLNADKKQVDAVLKKLNLYEMSEREILTAKQLSGGELKKIALGRALLRKSNIIILDEPYEYLDEAGRNVVNEILGDVTKTRIFIQHRNEIKFNVDKIIQL